MENFNFYCFLLAAGVFFVHGKNHSSENENASKDPNDKTKNVSYSNSLDKEVKEYDWQSFLIVPDEKLLFTQKLLQARKPGFLENYDSMPHAGVPIGDKRQSFHLTGNSGRYNDGLGYFQQERPTYFQAALGAISTHIVNQNNQEYIPYPPNGDPDNYPAYGGHPHATEPPIIKAYERSSSSTTDAQPLVDIGQPNLRRTFANNIYQRSFPAFANFGPDMYSGHFFNNGAPNQVRSEERMSKWHEEHTNEYAPVERVF